MAKKREQTSDLDLGALSSAEILALASKLTAIASEKRADERARGDSPSRRHSARDPLVRQLAAIALREFHAPVEEGGKGLSLRQIAKMFGMSPERVRQLYQDLVEQSDGDGEEGSSTG